MQHPTIPRNNSWRCHQWLLHHWLNNIFFSPYLTCCINNVQHQFPLSPSRIIFFACLLGHNSHLFFICECFFSVSFYKCISVTQLLNPGVSRGLVLGRHLLFFFFLTLSCVISSIFRASITTYWSTQMISKTVSPAHTSSLNLRITYRTFYLTFLLKCLQS